MRPGRVSWVVITHLVVVLFRHCARGGMRRRGGRRLARKFDCSDHVTMESACLFGQELHSSSIQCPRATSSSGQPAWVVFQMSVCSSAELLPRLSSAASPSHFRRYLEVLGICQEPLALYIRSTAPKSYLLNSIARGRKPCFLSIGGRVSRPPAILPL